MSRRFSREELELLKPAEIHFTTAIMSAYKRATGGKLDTLVADTYDNATDSKIQRNFSCGICSFNMYKTVGKKYFEDKLYYIEVDKQLEPKDVNASKSTDYNKSENNTATNKSTKDDSKGKKQGNKGNAKTSKSR